MANQIRINTIHLIIRGLLPVPLRISYLASNEIRNNQPKFNCDLLLNQDPYTFNNNYRLPPYRVNHSTTQQINLLQNLPTNTSSLYKFLPTPVL